MKKDVKFLTLATNPYKFYTRFQEDRVEHIGFGEDVVMENTNVVENWGVQRWTNLERIGEGAFGSVWLQKEETSGKKRAVKKIYQGKNTKRSFLRELFSLIKVRDCEHIVGFFGWYENPEFYFIAMEYAEYGDLGQYLKNSETKPTIDQAKEITYQLLKGLVVLHGKDICHRDLKPQNVLITSTQPIHIKLADFGVSKCFEGTELRTRIGTAGYLAPEILGALPPEMCPKGSNSYTKAVDMWALGCLVYNILTLKIPFLAAASTTEESTDVSDCQGSTYQREMDITLLQQFCNGENNILSETLEKLGVAEADTVLVKQFLVVNPKLRISASDALLDPWCSRSPPIQEQLSKDGDPADTSKPDGTTHKDAQPTTTPNELGKSAIRAAKDGDLNLFSRLLIRGADFCVANENGDTALHLASLHGHEDVVRLLLEKGVDVSAMNETDNTPLHLAAIKGREAIARLLLEKGADSSAVNKGKGTPLHMAAFKGRVAVARLLLDKGADVSAVNEAKDTPLHMAAFQGHEAVVRFLIEKGADLRAANGGKDTPLHLAAFQGHEAVVQLLLEKGAKVSAVNEGKETPIHLAAFEGHKSIVELLLEKGADLGEADTHGDTTLHLAALNCHEDIVVFLLEKGADLSAVNKNEDTPLHLAARFGFGDIVRLLLEKNADLDAVNKNEDTPLHLAARFGFKDIVQDLLDEGADLEAVNKREKTPMHTAALGGHTEVLSLLLENGAELCGVDDGDSVLHCAAFNGHEDAVRLLLENGADVDEANGNGETPLHHAAMDPLGGGIVRLLLNHGADVSAKMTESGYTPLHLATHFACKEIVDVLLSNRANPTARNNEGETAIDIACKNEFKDIEEELLIMAELYRDYV